VTPRQSLRPIGCFEKKSKWYILTFFSLVKYGSPWSEYW